MVAHNQIYDLRPNGLGHLSLVSATTGADAIAKLEMGLQLWTRNLILMIIFAQGLHLWLYWWERQADNFKYDRRELTKNARIFL